jgi:cytochrome c oxidase subunit III
MQNKPNHYYVPQQSGWPILGALALLMLAFGSLNLNEKWGLIAFLLGLGGLLFIIGGWLCSVSKESNAGLYNQQMDKTFRWGMFWFLISELFLFGLLLGSIFHVRFSITAWLAGHSGDASLLTHYLLWPDFSRHWPLTTPPANAPARVAYTFISMQGILFINTLLLTLSAILLIIASAVFKKENYRRNVMALNFSILFGFTFLILQSYYFFYLIKMDIIHKTGIYGSLLIAFLGLHIINILAAILLLLSIALRIHHHKITTNNTFLLDAGVWWWCFLTGVWLLGFLLLF